MSVLDNNWVIYKDPVYPPGSPLLFRPILPPSAVERLAALEDPEIAERIKKWDERHQFKTLDMLPDPAVPNAIPG